MQGTNNASSMSICSSTISGIRDKVKPGLIQLWPAFQRQENPPEKKLR